MALSPRLAMPPPDDDRRPRIFHDLSYSFDLHGQLIDMSPDFAASLGHERESSTLPHLTELLDAESWRRSREHILAMLGGAASEELQLTAVAKDGRRLAMHIQRRLLFEHGQPVAVQDRGRWLAEHPSSAIPHTANTGWFSDRLKELLRLSTTSYASFPEAIEDHLRTGCRLFGLPIGLVLRAEGSDARVHACWGCEDFAPGGVIPLARTRLQSVENRLRTIAASDLSPETDLLPSFETYLGTPIWLGAELFASLSFSSPYAAGQPFSGADHELVRLLARSIGRLILEHRIHSERDHLQNLENNRSRVLEMVAENAGIDLILAEICRLVQVHCPGAICAILILNEQGLYWTAAHGFPPDSVRLLQPLRVRSDDVLLNQPLYWSDVRNCPLWSNGGHLAAQLEIQSCRTVPILSTEGSTLGILALHFHNAQVQHEDEAALQIAGRLAAQALEQRGLSERLEFEARHDLLTGLPNRSHFMEILNAALREAEIRSSTLALLFIDLDRFKQINDILGHAMGDRLLREVGLRLKRLLTEDDLAGRMGGDEFIIGLTRQPDEGAAARAASEFLDALRAPHQIEDSELFVTASIGIAIYPRHGASAAELLRNADLAMYHVKNSGRNDVEVFRARDHSARLERLRLENALRRALENQEFELLYQPLVGMNGKVEGLEALLTWRHPVYGTISPKQFIPIAEETGLIIDIGSWVIRRACLEAAGWQKAGHSAARISVNVSALQFERRDFLDTVAGALAISNFPPDRLELELTESYIIKDLPQAAARLSQIRQLGVSIAIDDFGTGYSSLSYLSKLPVDALKIDQSFLRNLQEPEGSLAVIQSIVRMAHSINLKVVAEGVETRAELDLVRVLGCDRVQGHVYGPARSREEVERLLATRDSLRPLDV